MTLEWVYSGVNTVGVSSMPFYTQRSMPMPKQKRWHVKRKLSEAVGACNKAQNNLVETGHEYEAIHPDYYAAFTSIVQALESVKDAINKLSENI